MKMTLLELTQCILSDIGGDVVNSIFDTVESEQVAEIIRSSYYSMISTRKWPHLKRLVDLPSVSDPVLHPTSVSIPGFVSEIECVYYGTSSANTAQPDLVPIRYLSPDDFLRICSRRTGENLFLSGQFAFLNDRDPQYCTSVDDDTVIFDAYNSLYGDSILYISALAYTIPTWSHVDGFYPPLPADAFVALLEDAKVKSFSRVVQRPDQLAMRDAAKNDTWLSRRAWKLSGGIRYPNYGRHRTPSKPKDVTFKE